MKLIIDIDEDDYTMCQILAKEMCDNRLKLTDNLKYAISNGTPLPKGHGRLIDADMLCDYFGDNRSKLYTHKDLRIVIDNAPTIIEADKAESEEISDRNLKMWHDIYAEEKRREGGDKE